MDLESIQNRFGWLLLPLSWLWAVGSKFRNALYDRKIVPIHRLKATVISVGNLIVGGAGKTPLVHLLAQTLQKKGRLAILSRGYHREKSGLALGDEPTLLARRLPEIRVFVGPDRVKTGEEALQLGARALILDDGFQHRRLYRDFELIVLDARNLFGSGYFLPRGLLRDPPSRLKAADAVFINHLSDAAQMEHLQAEIRPFTAVPLIGTRHRPSRLLDLERRPQPRPKAAGLFCGIAQPSHFFKAVADFGIRIVRTWRLADHGKPPAASLARFAEECKSLGASVLICTEKDAVKLLQMEQLPLPIYYLEMELEIISGRASWEKLIEKIVLKMNN